MKPIQHSARAIKGALLLLMMCFATYSHAQNKNIKLTLQDKVKQTPIYFAHATLVNLKDSMIVCTQVTREDGIINFNVKDAGKYKIVVEKDGYTPETCYGTFNNDIQDTSINFTLNMENAVKKRAARKRAE